MQPPARRSVGGEQERQLMRVHKTTHSEARKQCGFNQGGPFGVRSSPVPGLLPVCLPPPQSNLGSLTFVGNFLWSVKAA